MVENAGHSAPRSRCEGGVMTVGTTASDSPEDRLELQRGYQVSCDIVRARARNFWYGLKLTPEPKRSALYAIYAWMREVDDIADDPGPTAAQRRASLEAFRDRTRRVFEGVREPNPPGCEWWIAFADVVDSYPVELQPFEEMIQGQLLDLEWTSCRDRESLEHFCRLVASTVGAICIRVWGHDDHPEVPEQATSRGIALQITNVLRDLREDLERGRVYLPADELEEAGLEIDDLLGWRVPDRCTQFMRDQVARARAHYRRSDGLESHLDPTCRGTSWAMCEIYRGILDRIDDDPERVVRERVGLGSWRKAGIAWKARRMAKSVRAVPTEHRR